MSEAPPSGERVTAPPRKTWLYAVVFAAGAALMAFELVGSRLLAPYFGSSIYVWGSLIGVFLGALSIGYATGGHLSDRRPTAGALAMVLALSSVLVAAVVFAAEPVQSAIVSWNPGIRLNPLLSAIVLFGPASVLMGMVSPYAVRLQASNLAQVGQTAGTLYGLSTMGSIAGTIGAAFWLIQSVGSEAVVLLVAGTLALCAITCAFASAGRGGPRAASTGALLLVIVAAMSGAGYGSGQVERVGNWSPVFQAGGYEAPFEPRGGGTEQEQVESQYHRIRVVDYDGGVGSTGPTRVLHFDNSLQAGVALNASGDADIDSPPLFGYVRAFDLLPLMRPDIERVLFVGLGSGAAPMRLHQLRPDVEIDAIEIDPEVARLARVWFNLDTEAVNVHVGDGRSWLAAQDTEWDAIVIDAYFADSIPFHLTTTEYLDVVEDHLAPGGLVAANLIGAVEGDRNRLLRSMLRTYRTHFDNLAVLPVPNARGELRLRQFGNVELYASDADIPTSPAEFQALLEEAGPPYADDITRAIADAVYTRAIAREGVPTLTDDYAPVDALLSVNPQDEG